MSRVANKPIAIPPGVSIERSGANISVKGSHGEISHQIDDSVEISINGDKVRVKPREEKKSEWAMAGTTRSILNNMVVGVSSGFEKKLSLVGVGFRAQSNGKVVSLTLGFSHPIDYQIPDGISIETPSQTEIVVKGCDKQKVGQVSANIRSIRPPEPYKGKGVRYAHEAVVRKEAKKK